MSKLLPEYHLSHALRFRIHTDGKLYASISPSSGEFYVAPEVLTILCYIAASEQKINIKNMSKNLCDHYKIILENLPNSLECDLIIKDLLASGLIIHKEKNLSRSLQNDGFADPWVQWAMLSDEVRSLSYERAIQEYITQESNVLDVGGGSGFLSAICLNLGAKKVLTIEETQIAQSIRPLFNYLKINSSQKKLTVFNHNSFDVKWNDSINLVVSELFGNDPFQEGVLPTLRNIGSRFQKQPLYIPLKIEIYFELIDILNHPIQHRVKSFLEINNQIKQNTKKEKTQFTQEFLKGVRNYFNFQDISFPTAFRKDNFKRISNSLLLGQMPLNPPPTYILKKDHPLFGYKKIQTIQKSTCVGGMFWYRVHLTKDITLSSHPQEHDASAHWSPLFILLNQNLNKGEEIDIKYGLNEFETQFICSLFLNKKKIGGRS